MMKKGYLFSVAIVPLFLALTPTLDQKEKGHKEHGKGKSEHHENYDDKEKRYKNENEQEHGNKIKHVVKHSEDKQKKWKEDKVKIVKGYKKEDKDYKWKAEEKWNDGKWDNERFENRMEKIKGNKRENWVNKRDYNGVSWWVGNQYYDAKLPKANKKVTLCHKPNSSKYPVTISVSVNALKAHLNHGDSEGNCTDYDRSAYSNNYWTDRTNYYNQYYQTTETLSFGEQLLVAAVNVLTNKKAQLVSVRPTLTASQVVARENAIINLQNKVYDLQTSLASGNQRVATINIVF